MISSRLEDIQQERRSPSPGQYEFRRKSEFDSDFSNVAKLAGEAAKQVAAMELDSESDSGESETGEDDDDLLISSDDTNEEGPCICFETSILMVATVLLFVVLLFAVYWMMNLEMPDMEFGCPDIMSGKSRFIIWISG